MQDNNNASVTDLLIVWIGTVVGHFTLSDAVMWATLIYTTFKIFVLVRDEFFKKE